MKQIPLTQGNFALVDDEDFDWLNQWHWHAHSQKGRFYAARNKGTHPFTTLIRMHRQIMNAPGNLHVDHINGNTLDNRRENLRLCTRSENGRNQRKRSDNTTGYKGVVLTKSGMKYYAKIVVHQQMIYLGCYATAEEAARAYDEAAKKYHGPFARTNF